MNFKSKAVSLSTAVVLTLAIAGSGFAAGTTFKDIVDVSAKDKIISLQDRGYVSGVAKGIFAPGKLMTAAEGVQLLVKAFDLNLDTIRFIKEPKATDYFKKADNNAWYANAFIIASVHGFDLPNDLDPNAQWTREEFTYRLVKAAETFGNLPMIKLNPVAIADDDKITVEYSGAIQRSLTYGIAKLDAKGNFNPKSKITRAEAAEEVYNALEYLKAHPAPAVSPELKPAEQAY